MSPFVPIEKSVVVGVRKVWISMMVLDFVAVRRAVVVRVGVEVVGLPVARLHQVAEAVVAVRISGFDGKSVPPTRPQ